MCAAPIAERPAFTRSVDANSVLCAGCSARGNLAPMCLFPSIWLPLSVTGYQRMVARAGEAAGFAFQISSHVLRHSCGYKLANDGRDTRSIQHYLGHRSIVSTVRTLRCARSVQGFLEGLMMRVQGALQVDPLAAKTDQPRIQNRGGGGKNLGPIEEPR